MPKKRFQDNRAKYIKKDYIKYKKDNASNTNLLHLYRIYNVIE